MNMKQVHPEDAKNQQISDAINRNGNNFHLNVVDKLKGLGWKTLISPYYTDFAANIPREIDIIAEKEFQTVNSYTEKMGYSIFRLIIETKYIPDPHFIWFDNVDMQKKEEFLENNYKYSSREKPYNMSTRYSLVSEVGKLSGGMNTERGTNQIQSALQQVLHSSITLRKTSPMLSTISRHTNIQMVEQYTFPVIILNNFENIYKVNRASKPNHSLITTPSFVFESNYTYPNAAGHNIYEYFLIEVVDFNDLEAFLTNLESCDIPFIKKALDNKGSAYSQSMNSYISAGRKL